MEFILSFSIHSVVFLVVFGIFAKIKEEITYKKHCKVIRAILKYRTACEVNHETPVVHYNDMMDFEKSSKRIFDFGYKNILPKEKFEIIKLFMED